MLLAVGLKGFNALVGKREEKERKERKERKNDYI